MRHEVHEVHAQRRHARQAVVREHVERAGEDVVEAPHNHVPGLEPALDDVDRRAADEEIRRVGVGSANDIASLHGKDGLGRVAGGLTVDRPLHRYVDAHHC